ncbi:MAG: YfhO family protein [Candidatus Nitrosotenuis sp.]
MVPFISNSTLGGDYLRYSLTAQKELLFALKTGTFPLYLPGFAGGNSSSVATLGQLFHPFPHIASLMPGYWDGKAIDWNNLFKLLSLGFIHLILFAFLQQIKLNTVFSFLLSFITVYNLRLIYAYQYGAASEAYTGYLLLCVTIGWYFIKPSQLKGPLTIIGATYLLVCSGHPEEMYYGLLAAGLFTFISPSFLSAFFPEKQFNSKIIVKFWLKVGFYLCLGMILSSAYIIPFYLEFIKLNAGRVGKDYISSNINLDTFIGTLNNFFLPLHSMPHTAFGGSSLILIPMLLPLVIIFKKKIPYHVWIMWGILFISFLHMQGSRTPVHKLVWEYLPFASSIRVPGRISIIIPFFSMMLMAWIIKQDSTIKSQHIYARPLTILSFISVIIIFVYYVVQFSGVFVFKHDLFLRYFNPYFYDRNFFYISPFLTLKRIELFLTILGILSIIILIIYNPSSDKKNTKILCIFLIILAILQTGITLRYRSINFAQQKIDYLTFDRLKAQKREKIEHPYYQGSGWHSSVVTKQLKNSFMEPFLGKIFTEVIPVSDQDEAYKKMWIRRLPQQVFIEGYDTKRAEQITCGAKEMKEGNVRLVYSSYNRLEFRVYSQTPAIFGLSYPYTGNWRAWVNGERTKVYRANGAAHVVEIPEGESIIEFRYWSDAFFWGMIVSCTTFTLIGVFVGIGWFRRTKRLFIVILAMGVGPGIFGLWYMSLYNGENFETRYEWTFTPQLESPNIAYGKKNWTNLPDSYLSETHKELELYRGKMVDGDKEPGNGFITCYYDSPAWFIDLSKDEKIKRILFYYSNDAPFFLLLKNCSVFEDKGERNNRRKIYDILISNDGERWKAISSFEVEYNGFGVREVIFQDVQVARFVQIKLRGRGQLSFDEIEIY